MKSVGEGKHLGPLVVLKMVSLFALWLSPSFHRLMFSYPFCKYTPFPAGYAKAVTSMRNTVKESVVERMAETPETKELRLKQSGTDFLDIFLSLDDDPDSAAEIALDNSLLLTMAGHDSKDDRNCIFPLSS